MKVMTEIYLGELRPDNDFNEFSNSSSIALSSRASLETRRGWEGIPRHLTEATMSSGNLGPFYNNTYPYSSTRDRARRDVSSLNDTGIRLACTRPLPLSAFLL